MELETAEAEETAAHRHAPPPFRDTRESPIPEALRERLRDLVFGADARHLSREVRRRRVLAAIDRDIARIDALLGRQVNVILHHPRFQRLEASWRGVGYLVSRADGVGNVKIRVLNLSWAELCRDLERAIEFDQSQLFLKVYSEEFGMPGGEPYGLIVADYEVQHRRSADHPTDDIAMLRGIASVAAAAFAPCVLGAGPAMLGLDDFGELALPFDLQATFRQVEYARWRDFQDSEDSRFVGITLPRMLMRQPYRDDGSRVDRFRFQEDVGLPHLRGYLWGNAAYAFASVAIRAFGQSGWFADIRGAERDQIGGGLVEDLIVPWFETDRAGVAIRYSTDVSVSEQQEKQLADLGFIPLSKCANTEYSVFYSNQSVQTPRRYDRAGASLNAKLSAMLQYILCVSRFAHYVKVIARDRVGSFVTAQQCEDMLQRWLLDYCTGNDDASAETKARYPLREARAQVREIPGRPGTFSCTVHLQPHFQLDQIMSSFRLVTELTPREAA